MTTPPGWYPDPSGLPFDRFWNGATWTEQTRAAAAAAPSHDPFTTAPLPQSAYGAAPLAYPAQRPWYRRKAFLIPSAIIGGLIIIGAIGAAVSPPSKTAAAHSDLGATVAGTVSTPPALTSSPAVKSTSTHDDAPSSTPSPKRATKTSAAPARVDDGSFTMPNEVGQVLQDAQDDIQRVSGDPVFFSHSHDLLGDRFQVLDDNWKVCDQNVRPGKRMSAVAHIDFGVVKLSESCP